MSGTTNATAQRILFTGYAPVHFACFRPLYEQLADLPGVKIFLSGGLRTKTADGYVYDECGLYSPFGLPQDRILPVAEIRTRDFDLVFAANTKLILPRSVRTRVQLFHGISFRNKAIRPDNTNCDHYFVTGPYMYRRFVEAGLFQEDDPRVVKVGFMKTDRLLNGQLSRSTVLERFGFDGDRPVLLYAPTGAKANSLETMGEEVIERLSRTGRYDLLIKPHDHPKNASIDWHVRLARFEQAHCKIVRDPDVIPLCYVADLLISDASSVANEYALLDRPIVYLDVPKLIKKARAAENSMVDLDTWGRKGGAVVSRPEQVEVAVAQALRFPAEHSSVRRSMVQDLFYNRGKAADAALSWFRRTVLRDEVCV